MLLSIIPHLIGVSVGYFNRADYGDPFRCPHEPIWVETHSNVTAGFDMIRRGLFKQARSLLAETSVRATADLSGAFNCSIGISALYRALAYAYAADHAIESANPHGFLRANHIGLRMMHVAMNWLTHAFVKKGINEGRWIDESSWPITIQEINDEETAIQRTISRLGHEGHSPAWDDCPMSYRDPSLRIGIVTMCDYPPDNPLPKYSRSNKVMYAERWGYTIIEQNKRSDESRPHAWGKMSLLQRYALSDEFDWLLWFDCDTYFMNFNITLDYVLFKYGGIEGVDETGTTIRYLPPDLRMLIQEDHAMLNTGVFFLKPGQWAADLLKRVYGQPDSPWIDHPWWENAAFSNEFLGTLATRAANFDFGNDDSSDVMDGIYPSGIKVVPQRVCNSYHPITSRVIMHDNWEPAKFVLAFSGCTSGSSPSVVKALYANYYRLMCQLNDVQDQCITIDELLEGQ